MFVKAEDAALSESNGGWRQTSTKENRAAEFKLSLRLAPKVCADGIRTWKQQPRVGGSGRPGEMQAKKKEEEAIQEKR